MEQPARKKIGVVVVHGMGEQVPMATIRDFVQTAWIDDADVHWHAPSDEPASAVWAKPDQLTSSYELRRITTRWTRARRDAPDSKGPRVDFFEAYWADLAEGTKVEEVYDWLWGLLCRRWGQVPHGLHAAWLLLWALALAVAGLSLLTLCPLVTGLWKFVVAGAAAGVALVMNHLVAPYAGDVARYVRADPRNVALRKAVRDRIIRLLDDLHTCGQYERIIVVGHSLGSIIAYDVISMLWATRRGAMSIDESSSAYSALRAVEAAARELPAAPDEAALDRYRAAQKKFRLELRDRPGCRRDAAQGQEWLVSDFITLGSPLTHAPFLIAASECDLKSRQREMFYPTCPPAMENVDTEQREKMRADSAPSLDDPGAARGVEALSFYGGASRWIVNHAAPFAPVRWTNIHDPHCCIFLGDIISGPLAKLFGRGVRDVDLKKLRGQAKRFTHTSYWRRDGEPQHVAALRDALDLLDER